MSAGLPEAQPGWRRALVLSLLALGALIAYLDRTSLSVVLAVEDFRKLFRLTDTDRGFLNAAFFFSYALLQIPAGWLVDRKGVRRPYAAGFLLWGLASAATSLAASAAQLFGLRVLLGVGESIVAPASMRWIRFNFPEQQRGFAVAIYLAGIGAGLALGAPATAALVSTHGWQTMFLTLGLGSLLWLIPWMALATEGNPRVDAASNAAGDESTAFRHALGNPALAGAILGTFSYNYFLYFSMTWMPAYLVERRGLSLNSMGFYLMLGFGGLTWIAVCAGWLADRLIAAGRSPIQVRKGFAIAGLLLGSSEILATQVSSQAAALFFVVFSLTGLGLASANCWALTHSLAPGPVIGRIIGLQNFVANAAGILAPIVTGWLKQTTSSYDSPFLAVWVCLLAGVASYTVLVREPTGEK